MRYIEPKKELDKKSLFGTIQQFGCGPNFVLNRWNAFEQMIEDQGVTFWFRLWLTFTNNPGSSDLKAVQNQWPELITKTYTDMHARFLQGSVQDACSYCSEVLNSMRVSPSKKECRFRNECITFLDLLQQCTSMAFGSAMCVIFYKWLVAKEFDPQFQSYWTCPKKYLERFYKPDSLEEYLVYYWAEGLVSLLGVSEHRLPWIKRLIHGKKDSSSKRDLSSRIRTKPISKCNLGIFIQKIAEVMKLNERNLKMEIASVDEQLSKYKMLSNSRSSKGSHSEGGDSSKKAGSKLKQKRRQCTFCFALEGIQTKFKICKRCTAENWPDPNYYCSDECQIEHWFKAHHREHFLFVQNRAQQFCNVKFR